MKAGTLRVGFALALTLAVSLSSAHAQVVETELFIQAAKDACPNARGLQEQLEPLVGAEVTLHWNEDPPAHAGGRVFVHDLGPSYAIKIDDLRREIADASRDCLERARVAAVFIALNARASARPDEPAQLEGPPRLALGVQVLGAIGYAGEIERATPGGGAGVWLDYAAFRFAFSAAVLGSADVALDSRDGVDGAVELVRIPTQWTASYLFRTGRLAFGPAAGLALDLLHARGSGVSRPQSALRSNLGAVLAIDAALALDGPVSVLLRVGASGFPRAYDLNVPPLGRLGGTPQLWLGATLGLGLDL